ncbi:acyl-CoA thioesterase [Deinococcus cellulosilyticus]|uniref:HotDog ACOT-type domain-containing protein n=1 Tax=Deinococcus cellulosilyticus (strain DSM 18568 / NBRC 106333 / KACC 11606 / 5516J-15) TaxID=1223518 RepID=A0A511N2R2_DEIC1|nr:acyl-CoA thioesterase [Deinococcus cellulosilyticus]GEM47122.1 hypothetical protein DC3_27570 [Deinococcus cellulosilyticus NBRC 106333 = KACC 11606]
MSEARMLEIIFPANTNNLGTAFGGHILSLMDKAASIAAVRHCRKTVVTVSMDTVTFHVPIKVGDAVNLYAQVVKVGRTSMHIQVDVHKENLATAEQVLATSGRFVFVALDAEGKPTPVPPLDHVHD